MKNVFDKVLDDNFPYNNEKNEPAFSRGNGSELWVLLLEKAYAKAYGSYENIEGGISSMALRDLTGAPYFNIDNDPDDIDKTWDFIQENLK